MLITAYFLLVLHDHNGFPICLLHTGTQVNGILIFGTLLALSQKKRPCGSILHNGSENFLLEVAHITSAHMPLAQKSQLSKLDIKEVGGGVYHLSTGGCPIGRGP